MLDIVIALVVVVLMLAVMVEAVQSLVKKLLRLKTGVLQNSLIDLFELAASPTPPPYKRKFLRLVRLPGDSFQVSSNPDVRRIWTACYDEFRRMGRVSYFDFLTMESISKQDLLRVLSALPATTFGDAITPEATAVAGSCAALTGINAPPLTGYRESPSYGDVRENLSGLLALAALDLSDPGRQAGAFGDRRVVDLRSTYRFDAPRFLAAVTALEGEIAAKGRATATADTAALQALAAQACDSGRAWDRVLAPVEEFAARVDRWYDPVMQSFEERYDRGMKSLTVALSVTVVLVMNADVFQVYHHLARSAAAREAAANIGRTVVAETRGPGEPRRQPDEASAEEPSSPPAPDAAPKVEAVKEIGTDRVVGYALLLERDLGLRPAWVVSKGDASWTTKYRKPTETTILGWLVMAALLTFGAPFWHDTLESLFSTKQYLRRSSREGNVEQKSGAGKTGS